MLREACSLHFRVIWVLCVVAALALFLFQVADRIFDYLNYNTTVAVDLRYVNRVPFPAVTLCNINTFRYVKLREVQVREAM